MLSVPYWLFISVAAVVSWWLSGYDSGLTGADQDRRKDIARRAVRVGLTLVLLTGAVMVPGPIAVFIFLFIAIIWAGCCAEFGARQFHKLLDPDDKREFDPKQTVRGLDRLAQLVREGRNEEAVEWCRQLEEAGDITPMAIEGVLTHVYAQTFDRVEASPALLEVQQLREQQKFGEAELKLKSVLEREPANWPARLMLLRVYADDFKNPDRAISELQTTDTKHFPPAFVSCATRSIREWSGQAAEKPEEGIEALLAPRSSKDVRAGAAEGESADALLERGQLATAIELLEHDAREQPENFDAWMRLIEAHVIHCHDIHRAEKILRQMQGRKTFSDEQIRAVQAKLREWRKRR